MKKTNKMTEEQILDSIIDLYLARNPRVERYAVTFTSSEDDSEETYYYPLSEAEKELIRAYENDKDNYCCLEEFLEQLESEESKALLKKLEVPKSPFCIDTLQSCDLNDFHCSSRVKLYIIDEYGTKGCADQFYLVNMNNDEFRKLMKIFILRKNCVSVNMLTYLYPEFTSAMMEHLVNTVCHGTMEFYWPFSAEMTEINDIVDSIMIPSIDALNLFTTAGDEILEFLIKYAIVPTPQDIYSENTEKDTFHVFTNFRGNRFHVEQERVIFDNCEWTDMDEQEFDANILCKHFNLEDYYKLSQYVKAHFNTITALNDIREFVKNNCPDAICK